MTQPANPRLLALDDLPMNLDLVCEILHPHGYSIDRADCIQAALSLMQVQTYDLYLLDIQLPDGSGDALLQLRRQGGDQTPAIAITGELDQQRRTDLLTLGFQQAIAKPFSADTLITAVRFLLVQHTKLKLVASHRADTNSAFDAYFDETQALATTGGNRELALHLRQLFRKDLAARMLEIHHAFRKPERTALNDARHKLAGAAGFVGASALSAMLAEFKANPSEQTLAKLDALVARMLQS
jgi:DNA-binding response OmpR family regulator